MPIKKKYKRKPPQVGEAGFTMIEMIIVIVLASILGIFIFGVLNKCLVAQIDMQVRKEMSDDAVRTMDKVNRELREASVVWAAINDLLIFDKSISSSSDTNLTVMYTRNTVTNTLTRQSAVNISSPFGAASVIATDMNLFNTSVGAGSRYTIQMEFESTPGANDGSEWVTYVLPRNL